MDNNPYSTSVSESIVAVREIDPAMLHEGAKRLQQANSRPPSVLRVLFTWPGLWQWVIVGAIGCTFFGFVSLGPNAKMSTHWLVGYSAFVAGAALRDVGIARRSIRLWPAQAVFIDWKKVDETLSADVRRELLRVSERGDSESRRAGASRL